MAITDYKITDNEINTYNVKSAPDTLKANAQSNKNRFDRLGEFFISKYNSLLDFIQGDFVNVDEVGAGLTYENNLEWKHALHKNVMIANYSGNITQITTGYRTIIANVTGLTTDDFMDCIMNINGTDYQCADAYESGDYATTTCNVEGVEVTITYSLSGGDITLTHAQNPLDTLYWNIQMFSTVADKIPAKSLPGNITNNAYIELDARADKWNGVALQKKGAYKSDFASGFISHDDTSAKFTLPWKPYIGSVIRIEGTVTSGSTSTYVRKALTMSGTMSPVTLVDGLAVEYQSSGDESLVFYKTATDQTIYTVEVTIYYEGEYRKETNYIPVMESVYDDNAYLASITTRTDSFSYTFDANSSGWVYGEFENYSGKIIGVAELSCGTGYNALHLKEFYINETNKRIYVRWTNPTSSAVTVTVKISAVMIG